MNRTLTRLVACLVLGAGACSSDDGVDLADRDPRCVSACTAPEPPYDGIGRVCNGASHAQCLDECEVRIASVTPICQNCLVEEACFGPDGCGSADGPGGSCANNTCTVTTELGTCMFDIRDEAARLRCYQQVDPRREVACTPRFRPATECAAVCS